MSTLFLHVGPPKTATTFLQEEVLSRVESVTVLDKPTVRLERGEVSFGDLFCFSPDVWTSSGGQVFDRFLADYPGLGEKNCIISSEQIYGGFASPQPWIAKSEEEYGPIVRTDRHTDGRPNLSLLVLHLETLSRVAVESGFTSVKVLFTIRRQDAKLASGYAQMSSRVQGASQEGFECWLRHLIHDPIGHYAGGGEKLDFYQWWKKVGEALGRSNVFLLPFELLEDNIKVFLRRWLGFLEVKRKNIIINKILNLDDKRRNALSASRWVWSLKKPKRIGPVFSIPGSLQRLGLPAELSVRWPDFSRDRAIHLTPTLREEILGVFESQNRKLDEEVSSLNLKKYGYY